VPDAGQMVALQNLMDKSEAENRLEVHAALCKEVMRSLSGGKFDLEACVRRAAQAEARPDPRRRPPVAGPGRDRQAPDEPDDEPEAKPY